MKFNICNGHNDIREILKIYPSLKKYGLTIGENNFDGMIELNTFEELAQLSIDLNKDSDYSSDKNDGIPIIYDPESFHFDNNYPTLEIYDDYRE